MLTQEEESRLQAILNSKPRTIGRHEPQIDTLRHFGRTFGFIPANLIETGTIRNHLESPDGWGAAMLIHWANNTDSKVWTVDISAQHIENCKKVIGNHPAMTYVVSDSVKFLKEFDKPIHLLYLDSYDFDETHECYQHQLLEIQAAMDKLVKGAVIVSDDNYKEDWTHGKGNYSIPWMLKNGFKLIQLKESQAMLEKL